MGDFQHISDDACNTFPVSRFTAQRQAAALICRMFLAVISDIYERHYKSCESISAMFIPLLGSF